MIYCGACAQGIGLGELTGDPFGTRMRGHTQPIMVFTLLDHPDQKLTLTEKS